MLVILATLVLTVASASADPGWFAPDRAVGSARIEVVNAAGERFVSEVETMPHTSLGWLHAEGKVAESGQPIRFNLEFTAK